MLMNMKKMVSCEEQIFNTKLRPFDFNDPPESPETISNTMIEHLEYYKGVGLSANQIGLSHRVFVIRTEPRMVCFNPTITWYSEKTELIEEGCLTFPYLYVKIRRPSEIRAKYQDQTGAFQTTVLDGLVSRCYQHELDHLDGINYLSRANQYHLNNAKRKMKIMSRKMKKYEQLKPLQGNEYGN